MQLLINTNIIIKWSSRWLQQHGATLGHRSCQPRTGRWDFQFTQSSATLDKRRLRKHRLVWWVSTSRYLTFERVLVRKVMQRSFRPCHLVWTGGHNSWRTATQFIHLQLLQWLAIITPLSQPDKYILKQSSLCKMLGVDGIFNIYFAFLISNSTKLLIKFQMMCLIDASTIKDKTFNNQRHIYMYVYLSIYCIQWIV